MVKYVSSTLLVNFTYTWSRCQRQSPGHTLDLQTVLILQLKVYALLQTSISLIPCPSTHTPTPCNHLSHLCFYECIFFFKDYTYKWHHPVSVFVWLQWLQVHPCCWKWQDFLLFLMLNNISLYKSYFLDPFSHLWTLGFVSVPWLLWIMRQWTWEYTYLVKITVLFPLDIHEKWNWDCWTIWWSILNLSRNFGLFSTVAMPDYNLISCTQGYSFCHDPCWHLLSLLFLIIDIPTDVRWHLIVVLVCISLMISDVEHLFMYLTLCMSSL